MGVRIIDDGDGKAAFYCSTTMWAFGPVMKDADEAEAFLNWLPTDPRKMTDSDLEARYYDFCGERDMEHNKQAKP